MPFTYAIMYPAISKRFPELIKGLKPLIPLTKYVVQNTGLSFAETPHTIVSAAIKAGGKLVETLVYSPTKHPWPFSFQEQNKIYEDISNVLIGMQNSNPNQPVTATVFLDVFEVSLQVVCETPVWGDDTH